MTIKVKCNYCGKDCFGCYATFEGYTYHIKCLSAPKKITGDDFVGGDRRCMDRRLCGEPPMTDMNSNLKPCPFCGGESALGTIRYGASTVREQTWDQDEFYKVNCIHCGANNLGLVGHKTVEAAAVHWNTRQRPPEIDAADEIERLRAERDRLQLAVDNWTLEDCSLRRERDEARAEAERLRAERDQAREALRLVALCRGHQLDEPKGISIGEAEANAHLSAAAPELYAAMRALLSAVEYMGLLNSERGHELQRNADAALSRARGEADKEWRTAPSDTSGIY